MSEVNAVNVNEVSEAALNTRKAFAEAAVATLNDLMKGKEGLSKKLILDGVSVDVFCALSSYKHNRPVESRSEKQAKKDVDHFNGDVVAVGILDPIKNKETWDAIKANDEKLGIPCTLPYFIEDGHTRRHAWTTPKGKAGDTLFTRPDSLFITVHRNHSCDEFYRINREYCNGVSAETNAERQQSADSLVGSSFVSAFVAGDSWKTAYREISRFQNEGKKPKDPARTSWDKDAEGAAKEFQLARKAIDGLKVGADGVTVETKKKLSGVRAALILSFGICDGKPLLKKWQEFWKHFYAIKNQPSLVSDLLGELGAIKTGDAKTALELCMVAFKEYAGLNPVAEEHPETETNQAA